MATRVQKGKPVAPKAKPDEAFWFHHGPIVFDLEGLHRALENETDDEQFKYHITGKGRNDYARWVGDVLMDDVCAAELKRLRSRKSAIKLIEGCLKRYA